ncbi:unnamed protein product [Ectocarpus fasciculatus]
MQRFGVFTRAHTTTAATQRFGVSARSRGLPSLPIHSSSWRQLSSFSSGPEHDDYWTAAKTEAQATPAYQQAASGDRWAQPGGPSPGTIPMGEAYKPSSSSNAPSSKSYHQSSNTSNSDSGEFLPPPPAFDMQSSTHLSPVKQADVRSFKGNTLVDIRQYFRGAQGQAFPTKKGIALTIPQWRRLQEAMPDIDKEIVALEKREGSVAAIDAHLRELAKQPFSFEVGDEEPDTQAP